MTRQEIQAFIDNKTKPLGSLGKLESLAARIALLQDNPRPELNKPVMLVFAADHGLAKEGVSPYPQEVTWQMVMNFLSGGAAINVFCKNSGMDLKVIDSGVNYDFQNLPGLVHAKIARGTASMLQGPAMTAGECHQALDKGASIVQEEIDQGSNIIGFGEMGIGNTSAAALLMHRYCDIPIDQCVGAGAGLDTSKIRHKKEILRKAAEINRSAQKPQEILAALGGLEIAMMAGGMMEAARQGALILVDGFIATSAMLAADAIAPGTRNYGIYCHCSDESGHRKMLDFLEGEPLLNLGLRLGEGTGAALAYPLVSAAAAFLREMASFEEAGVSSESPE